MEKKTYPTVKDAIFLCLLYIGIYYAMVIVLAFIMGPLGIGYGSQIYMRGQFFLFILSDVIVIYFAYKKSNKKFNEIIKFSNVSLHVWLLMIVYISGFTVLSWIIIGIWTGLQPLPQSILLYAQILIVYIQEHFMGSILFMGLIPAFTDEIFFRGIILNGFKENYSRKKSIILNAALNGALYGVLVFVPLVCVIKFLFGMISAWIFLKTKSIIPSIFINLFYRMAGIILIMLMMKSDVVIPIPSIAGQLTLSSWLAAIVVIF